MKSKLIISVIFILSNFNYSQWIEHNFNIRDVILKSIVFPDKDNGIIVGTKGLILHTLNAGDTWDSIYSPVQTDLEEVFFLNTLNGWITGDSGTVLYSSERGTSWVKLNNNISEKLYSIYFYNQSIGWIAGINIIYKTFDGGNSWVELKREENTEYYSIYFADSLNGWVVGDSSAIGVILKTSDGGGNWTTIYNTNFGYLSSVYFTSDSIGYISGENSIIPKTTDGGNSWFDLITISQGIYDWQDIYFFNENKGWVCSVFGAVANTTDGGISWSEQRPRFINGDDLHSIYFIDSLKGWAVGAGFDTSLYSKIIKTTNGGITSIDENSYGIPCDFFLLQNYPNPFNPSTKISYRIPNQQFVSLKVYDVLGNEIAGLVNEEKSAGSYNVKFVGSNLSSGIYIYRLISGNYISTKKMLMVK